MEQVPVSARRAASRPKSLSPAPAPPARGPALRNPQTGGREWYHGTRSSGAQLAGGFRLTEHDPEAESGGHWAAHWNALLGVHFAAHHRAADKFADPDGGVGGASGTRNGPRETPSVVHARLHLASPKHYASEHDMADDVYEHEYDSRHNYLSEHPDHTYAASIYFGGDSDHRNRVRKGEWETFDDWDDIGERGEEQPEPVYRRTQWLNLHPDKGGIVQRYKERLQAQGHDGIVYGNEEPGERVRSSRPEANLAAIAFRPDQIEITKHHLHGQEGTTAAAGGYAHQWDDYDEPEDNDTEYDTCYHCQRAHNPHEHAQEQSFSPDWEELLPRIPSVHRALGIVLPDREHALVHDPATSPGDAARVIAHHVTTAHPELGHTHWSAPEGLEHVRDSFSGSADHHRNADGTTGLSGPRVTSVVLHARTPEPEHVHTEADDLIEAHISPYRSPEWEVPISPGAPVHLTGVSWRRASQGRWENNRWNPGEQRPWQRHDFHQPMQMEAAARWEPSSGIFGPTTGLDSRLFTPGHDLRQEVRGAVMERLDQALRTDRGLVGSDWQDYLRVYLAGGSASEWAGDRPNDTAQDLDILIGVDYDGWRGDQSVSIRPMSDAEIDAELNAALRKRFNDPDWRPEFGGRWDLTAYVNPEAWDIRVIRPYAAWDISDSRWAVRPPHLPGHSAADFDPAILSEARAVLTQARAILRMAEPNRTRQARALWEHLHAERRRAFSIEGEGWEDPGNLIEKFLAYAPNNILGKIRDLALAPKTAAAGKPVYYHGSLDRFPAGTVLTPEGKSPGGSSFSGDYVYATTSPEAARYFGSMHDDSPLTNRDVYVHRVEPVGDLEPDDFPAEDERFARGNYRTRALRVLDSQRVPGHYAGKTAALTRPAREDFVHELSPHASDSLDEYRVHDGKYVLHDSGERRIDAYRIGRTGLVAPDQPNYAPGHPKQTLVGFLNWRRDDGHEGEIHRVQVHKQHRRKGVASAMLDFARERYPDLDIRHSGALTEDGKSWAQAKASREKPTKTKDQVNYRKATGKHHCGNCVMFRPHPPDSGSGSCTLVRGLIDEVDVCDEWYQEGKTAAAGHIVLYHGTSRENADSIARGGLRAPQGHIYPAQWPVTTVNRQTSDAYASRGPGDRATVEIHVPRHEAGEYLWPEQEHIGGGAYAPRKDLPAEWVRAVHPVTGFVDYPDDSSRKTAVALAPLCRFCQEPLDETDISDGASSHQECEEMHSCPVHGEHDDPVTAEHHRDTYTDWPEHLPIGQMHRGLPVELPRDVHQAVHDESRSVAERAEALRQHLHENPFHGGWQRDPTPEEEFEPGQYGVHWTDSEKAARSWGSDDYNAGPPGTGPKPSVTHVVLHARGPADEHIETDPDELDRRHMYGFDHPRSEREIPVRGDAPVHLTGISWKRGGTDDWHRHDFTEHPQQHTASGSDGDGMSEIEQRLHDALSGPAPRDKRTSILPSSGELYGGQIEQHPDGRLHISGEPVSRLYRVVDPGEWAEAQRNGYVQSRGGYTRASAQPDERWRYQGEPGVRGHTLEIDYHPEDQWRASAEGYAATHRQIPLSRVRKIASGSDGDRFVTCSKGHEHWGAHGAAGLLMRHEGEDGVRYLLQKRSPSVDHPGTWSIPSGAKGKHESPEDGALREYREEMGAVPRGASHRSTVCSTDCGDWKFHTVVYDSPEMFTPRGRGETEFEVAGSGWFTPREVAKLDLHPAFSKSWDTVRKSAHRLASQRDDDEPNRVVHSAVEEHVRQAHPELDQEPEDRTGTFRKMLGRASFFMPREQISSAVPPEHARSILDLAHHAAHVMTDTRQRRDEERDRMSWEQPPAHLAMSPDQRRHGKDFTWHAALALDGAGHRDAADTARRHYADAVVGVANGRHARGLSRDFPGSNLSPDMPPDLSHLPPMISSQREGLASGDRDYHRKMLDVARSPEPGLRLWRGERRQPGENIPAAPTVGMHWSVKPEAVITSPHVEGDSRPVVWQARLEHPESQAIPRSHPMWHGVHQSLDNEAEVRLRPGSSVHVEGAWVGEPGQDSPVYPLRPERNPAGWKWHPVGRHVPVSHRPGPLSVVDYSDVGFPKEAGSGKSFDPAHPDLAGMREVARQSPDFGSFVQSATVRNYHGRYWHLTHDPDFRIDPHRAPAEMSTLGDESHAPGLMVSTDPGSWHETLGGNRPYAAEIALHGVPGRDYADTSRGFGHEIFVHSPYKAEVLGVHPVEEALRKNDHFYSHVAPQSEGEYRQVWDRAHSDDRFESKTAAEGYDLTPADFTYSHENPQSGEHLLTAMHESLPEEGMVGGAYHGPGFAGEIHWWDDGEMEGVHVRPELRRRGLATELWNRARQITPQLRHSRSQTPDGRSWAEKTAAAPAVMYHASPPRNRPGIEEHGLRADHSQDAGELAYPAIYMSPRPSEHPHEDVWRVDTSGYHPQPEGPDMMHEFRDVGGSYYVDHDVPRERLTLHRRAGAKTGVKGYDLAPRSGMIYLPVPEHLIERVPGGVEDEAHITVVYLGKGLSDEAFARALEAAAEAAARSKPLHGVLNGIDTFPPSDSSDGKVPAFVPAYVPGIGQLRQELEYLSASEHKDFRPHVCLAYLEHGDPLPPPHPARQVSFTHLHVKRGDQVVRFPLGTGMSRTAAPGDAGERLPSGRRYLYHESPASERDSIRGQGLIPHKPFTPRAGEDVYPKAVYLSEPHHSEYGSSWPGHDGPWFGYDRWRVDVSGLDVRRDPDPAHSSSWAHYDTIPPERLKLHKRAHPDWQSHL